MLRRRSRRHTLRSRVTLAVVGAAGVFLGPPLAGAQVSGPSLGHGTLVIDDVTVIDVRNGDRLSHQTVIVEGTRIRAVGRASETKRPAEARVIDGRDKYLIPGLWDMHTHIFKDCLLDLAYPWLVANGITGIRELNVPSLAGALRVRNEVAAGVRAGPRMVISGPALGGEDIPTDCAAVSGSGLARLSVRTPEDARRIVDSLRAAGADLLKIYSPSRTVFFAIAAEARRVGIPIAGHLPDSVTMIEASDSGMRSVEHLEHLERVATPEEGAAWAERFQRNGTWFSPTLTIFAVMGKALPRHPEREHYWPKSGGMSLYGGARSAAQPSWMPAMARLHAAGMPMLAGTDGPRLFGDMQDEPTVVQDELELLVRTGSLTPLEALQTATLNPALYLHATDSLGHIGPGQVADLVLLDGDPLAAIENAAKIDAVVANGRFFDRAALDALLEQLQQAAEAAP